MYVSSRLVVVIDLYVLLSSLLLIPVFNYIDFFEGATICKFIAINSIAFLLLMKFWGNVKYLADYFACCSLLVFTAFCWYSGGINSVFVVWYLTIPPISFMFMKTRRAKFWTVATLIALFVVGALSIAQRIPESSLSSIYFTTIEAISLITVVLLLVVVVLSFQNSYRKVRDRLADSNENLKASNQELERFASIASHDLKTPIRNIISFISLFERRNKVKLDQGSTEYLGFVKSSANQMYRLIEDILEFSKLGTNNDNKEVVDLNEIVYSIVQQYRSLQDYGNIAISKSHLPIIVGDRTRMHQLFTNFIENGLKYNESHNPSVSISHREENQHHHFVFEDNGIGIDESFKDKIFEMFSRLHGNDHYKGTGIGLAICKKIITQYKGEIDMEAIANGGTCFTLRFPVETLPHHS